MRGAYCASTNPSPRLASAATQQGRCCWPRGWGASPTSSLSPTLSRDSRTKCWREFLHELRPAMKFLHGRGAKKQSSRVVPCARSFFPSCRGDREDPCRCFLPSAPSEHLL